MLFQVTRLFTILYLGLFISWASPAEDSSDAPGTPAWRQRINKSLDKIEAEISEMDAKTKSMSAQAQAEWKKTLSDLRTHRDKLKEDLKTEKGDAKEKAKDFWGRFKAAFGELEQGVAKAAKKIKGDGK